MEKPHVTITIGEKGEKKESRNTPPSTSNECANDPGATAEDTPNTTSIEAAPMLNGISPMSADGSANNQMQTMQQTSITAIIQTPNQTIPLRIPFPINIPQYTPTRPVSLCAPPPLPQLKPFTNLPDKHNLHPQRLEKPLKQSQSFSRAILIPAKLKSRMEELGLNEKMFIDLLREYETSRDLYINTLKRGYLMFFPYLLGSKWCDRYPNYPIPGRKLVSLIDMYIEEKRKTKVAPEYLTKVPCNFVVTESILKEIQHCHIETIKRLQKSTFERFSEGKKPMVEPAQVYVEMCKTWLKVHPDIRMTTKQLISIHRMLDYEHQPMLSLGCSQANPEPSPEIVCHMADVWKLLDKEVPDQQIIVDVEDENNVGEEPIFDEECMEIEQELRTKMAKNEPDDEDCFDQANGRLVSTDTLSIEQHQEWITSTHLLPNPPTLKKLAKNRPRYVGKNPRLFWSNRRINDLMMCRNKAIQRFKCKKRRADWIGRSQLELLYSSFKRLHEKTRLSKHHILGKCIRKIRQEKRLRARKEDKQIQKWERMCNQFLVNEEGIEVINEESIDELKMDIGLRLDENSGMEANELDQPHQESSTTEGGNNVGLGGFRLTNLNQNLGNLKVADGNPKNLNFNKDQDVLAYIKETQNLTGKGNHGVTWTADVIADLVHARSEARRRKREWEIWATKKYGGIGIAYNNPNIHYQKVDEMFKEEWLKLRPDLSSLSVWTLVSYARKYDALKKQLIVDNGQVEDGGEQKVPRFGYRRDVAIGTPPALAVNSVSTKLGGVSLPSFSTVFFPESGLPKYDLEVLEKLDNVTQELKDLIRTRQMAKERQILGSNSSIPNSLSRKHSKGQPQDSEANLLYLWKEEWLKLRPEYRSLAKGNLLLKRLWTLFRVGSSWTKVRPALMRQTSDQKRKEYTGRSVTTGTGVYSFKPEIQEDEVLHIRPRRPVFPEDEWQELLHDEEMAPHSIGNRVLLWANLSPNPLLKRSKSLISGENPNTKGVTNNCWCWVQRQDDKCSCSSPNSKLVRKQLQQRDEVSKPPPQKHTLICLDRELFGQMSLELEVPIFELAFDNNAAIDLDEQNFQDVHRTSRAYSVLQNGSNSTNLLLTNLHKTEFLQHDNQGKCCLGEFIKCIIYSSIIWDSQMFLNG